MKVFGNIDFAAQGQVTPDADIGDDRVAIETNTFSIGSGQQPTILTGMILTPGQGTHLLTFNGQYSYAPANIITAAKNDLTSLRLYLKALNPTNTSHPLTFGGEVLLPGVYQIDGAVSVAGSLVFDGQNNPDSIFIIRCTGAFSVGAASVMSLINQAKAANVFWLSVGAVSIAAASTIKGTIISDAALGFGDGVRIEGRGFSMAGALALTNVIVAPLTSGVFDSQYRSLISFSTFTMLGAISNTGTSEVYGDIGTGGGAVSGFETSTLHGGVYTSTDSAFRADVGMYLNAVLIPHSLRTIVYGGTSGTGILSIGGLSGSILTGQNVSVRINVSLGNMTFSNRFFSSQKFMG